MFKSKLKSLFSLERKWMKFALIGLGVIVLVAILALLGSMLLPDGGLKFNQLKTTAPVGEEVSLTPGAEPQFEAPKSLTDPEQVVLAEQVRAAAAAREDVMAFIIYDVAVDSVEYSKDGKLALVWISLVDKESGLVQPGEPGLVIAQEKKDPTKPWKLTFQADADFAAALQAVPNKLLSAEVKEFYMPALQQEQKAGVVYRGYRLPWKPGQTVRLTGSIGHVYTYKSCPSSCLYAFDFANGTMFDVVAAKAGTVKYVVWKYENGDPKNANYIVLEDTSTNPTTYQVYLHLAHESIPAELRKVGAKVVQGQFLGKADDTGYSTGHHLHFHVHTNPDSYWGKSVDIVFEEVTVNGGRPRLCSEAKAFPQFGSECMPQDKYISNNGDAELPTGGISSPEPGAKIKAPTVNITGWMKDDMGVASGQLYIKIGSQKWKPIGTPIKKTEFSRSLDLCAAGIPEGEFSLAIEVTDQAGNVSALMGETKLVKNYECPAQPPVCVPANNEVALYSDPDFQGSCQLLKAGEYANLADLPLVGADKAQSIQVGSNVTALLYPEIDFAGVEEVFQDGDNNLGNNPIGSANAASAKVIARQLLPAPVSITLPDAISTDTVLTIAWSTEAGVETRAALKGPGEFTTWLDWQAGGTWQVGRLDRGNYTLVVEARNAVGIATTTQEFSVNRVNAAPETHMQYLAQGSKSTSIKLTWVVDSGAATIDHFDLQWREGKGEWTAWTEPLGRTAREAIFWAVPDKLYEFRIRAVDKNGTEEAFTSKPETSTYVLPDCADDAYEGEGTGDDERASAPVAQYGAVQTHNWCQLGDIDWVVFQAAEGDALTLRVDPVGAASGAIIKLFDAGSDEPLAKGSPQNADSATVLNWTAPAPGTYAVKLSPADARIAGEDAQYTFSLQKRSLVKTSWFLVLVGLISALLGGGFFTHRRIQAKKMQKGVGW
jgi:murein DD-endopeptidase MepM/ murein hydrolase activator NlpD